MKTNKAFPQSRSVRTDAARRAQLLATFDRSGLSAAAFARQHGLNYTTFCGWRVRRAKTRTAPAFVQVEVAAPPVELVIEVGPPTRLRIHSESQIVLAARLLRSLNAPATC